MPRSVETSSPAPLARIDPATPEISAWVLLTGTAEESARVTMMPLQPIGVPNAREVAGCTDFVLKESSVDRLMRTRFFGEPLRDVVREDLGSDAEVRLTYRHESILPTQAA
jgi:hypothetical protein